MSAGGERSQTSFRGGVATAVVAAAGLIGATAAALLFDQAVPQVRLQQRLTAPRAVEAARTFANAHALPFPEARTAVRFAEDDSLQLFLELAPSAGKAALDQVVKSGDVALYRWTVRALTPGDVHETRVRFAPDGRVTGFWRRLAETDRYPALDSAVALSRARGVLTEWMGHRAEDWSLVSASREVVPASGRVDQRFTFEHISRRVAGASVRVSVEIGGDTPTGAREFVVIPEAFQRRYAEMRASNQLLAQLAAFGFPVYGMIALLALYRGQREGTVRWRGALVAATVIAGLQAASMANEIPGSWYSYPTTAPPGVFLLQQALAALVVPLLFGAFLVVVLAGGEWLVRGAFPGQLDWWSAWRARGTAPLTRQVLAGYALCAVGLGYVATFYYVARHLLGWWVPSALLDDPNQIATPLPWLSAVANAAQAGVMEEVLFRAIPLSAVAVLTRGKAWHRPAMAAAVVGTALVFGFAHASYASWPAYSRGVELFAEAVLWALVFLRFGLVPTVVCHFTFDLFLFGLFAMAGDAPAYRVTLAVVLAVMLAPAVFVVWTRWRRGARAVSWETVTFGAWRPAEAVAPEESSTELASRVGERLASSDMPGPPAASVATAGTPTSGSRDAPGASRSAEAVADARRDWRPLVVAIGAALLVVPRPLAVVEPRFTVDRARAITIADSVLRARGARLDGLTPMAQLLDGEDPAEARYLAHVERRDLLRALARSYRPLTGWGVRFDRRTGTPAEKAEGWRLHLLGDGTPHDWRHVLPEEAERPDADREAARGVALAAAAASGIDTSGLRDAGVEEERRPHRRDLVFVFADRLVPIPGGASARVRVRVAGNEAVGVARMLRLPERWERQDEAVEQRRGTLSFAGFILGLLVVMALAAVIGRRAPLIDDHPLSRRAAAWLVVAGVGVLLLRGFNALPDALAQWDTATPWRSHEAAVVLAVGAQLFAIVLPGSLWLSVEALRRRVGVRARGRPREVSRSAVALGALAFASTQAWAWLAALRGRVVAPETMLGDYWPALGGPVGVAADAVLLPLAAVVPCLIVAGVARGRWARPLLIVSAALGLAALSATRGVEGARVAPLLAMVLLVLGYAWWAAVVRWGRDGVWAWVGGGAAYAGFAQLQALREAAHSADQWSAWLGVLVAAGLVVLVSRFGARSQGPPTGV